MATAAVESFTPQSPSQVIDDVRAPSLSSTNALARFEFESGKPAHGATKVLMVEWMDTTETLSRPGQWHINWEDRHSVLPAAEDPSITTPPLPQSSQHPKRSDTHRIFFLLPPATAIPPTVTLHHIPSPLSSSTADTITWHTNPLPAIFPPELGASAREAGKKGVLHTLWAKKRLSVLSKEIEEEYRINFEGIGLEMAIQERDWITQNFGVTSKPTLSTTSSTDSSTYPIELRIPIPNAADVQGGPASPQTPRSPGGGRLLEKMRGLKIGTSSNEWGRNFAVDTPPQTTNNDNAYHNPLSPEVSDVAASGFEAIKGLRASAAANAAASSNPALKQETPARRMIPLAPPQEVLEQQQPTFDRHHGAGMASLAAAVAPSTVNQEPSFTSRESSRLDAGLENDHDDDAADAGLFQLPMSPRSPEMTKSPFSFAIEDTAQYAKTIQPEVAATTPS